MLHTCQEMWILQQVLRRGALNSFICPPQNKIERRKQPVWKLSGEGFLEVKEQRHSNATREIQKRNKTISIFVRLIFGRRREKECRAMTSAASLRGRTEEAVQQLHEFWIEYQTLKKSHGILSERENLGVLVTIRTLLWVSLNSCAALTSCGTSQFAIILKEYSAATRY